MSRVLLALGLQLLLVGCSSSGARVDYQNTFWLGCMNAYLRYAPARNHAEAMKHGNVWCIQSKREVDALSGSSPGRFK